MYAGWLSFRQILVSASPVCLPWRSPPKGGVGPPGVVEGHPGRDDEMGFEAVGQLFEVGCAAAGAGFGWDQCASWVGVVKAT